MQQPHAQAHHELTTNSPQTIHYFQLTDGFRITNDSPVHASSKPLVYLYLAVNWLGSKTNGAVAITSISRKVECAENSEISRTIHRCVTVYMEGPGILEIG